jgi:hypothetical protein
LSQNLIGGSLPSSWSKLTKLQILYVMVPLNCKTCAGRNQVDAIAVVISGLPCVQCMCIRSLLQRCMKRLAMPAPRCRWGANKLPVRARHASSRAQTRTCCISLPASFTKACTVHCRALDGNMKLSGTVPAGWDKMRSLTKMCDNTPNTQSFGSATVAMQCSLVVPYSNKYVANFPARDPDNKAHKMPI